MQPLRRRFSFDEITRKQVPFATAVAITRSARDRVEATRESVRRKFNISK